MKKPTRLLEPKLSAHDRVYRGVRNQIMFGQIDPGQALTLRGIGDSYGVSMTPARESVQCCGRPPAWQPGLAGRFPAQLLPPVARSSLLRVPQPTFR